MWPITEEEYDEMNKWREDADASESELSDLLATQAALIDLVRFLSKCWKDGESLRYKAAERGNKEVSDLLIMKWPVVQGTRNQLDLMKIAEQDFKSDNLRKAVDFILAG